jgi:hypothetical protein
MTPEEALRNILSLVNGSDEVEDVHALQILLQSIGTLAEKGLGRSEWRSEVSRFGSIALCGGMPLRPASVRR